MTSEYHVVFSRRAARQILDLERYITEAANEVIADRYIGRLLAACHALSKFPLRGTRRDDLLPGLRVIGFERRVSIAFTVEEPMERVEIHGVFYGGQDFEQLLRDSDD